MGAIFPLSRRARTPAAEPRASTIYQARFPEGIYSLGAKNKRAIFAEVGGRFGSKEVLLGVVISVLAEDKEYGIDSEAVSALFAASPALHSTVMAMVRLSEDMDQLDNSELRAQLKCIAEGGRAALALTVNPIRQVAE